MQAFAAPDQKVPAGPAAPRLPLVNGGSVSAFPHLFVTIFIPAQFARTSSLAHTHLRQTNLG
jgi:hypothetical protein